jgi:hypothetical protein
MLGIPREDYHAERSKQAGCQAFFDSLGDNKLRLQVGIYCYMTTV